MATNPAPFPVPNESPYGDKVQTYIDSGDTAVEVAAGQAADQKIVTHSTAGDPHPAYRLRAPENIANGVDLNTLTTSGLYIRSTSVGNTGLNYPVDNFAGYVEVWEANGYIRQEATYLTSATALADAVWVRTKTGANAFTAWSFSTARPGAANVFTAGQAIETSGIQFRLQNPNAPADKQRWNLFSDNGTGAFQITPSPNNGALPPADERFFFFHDRRVRFGGIDQIAGTGNPNGVVVAPVGSTFRNTEAGGYNGARVWRKDAGTGSTGWVVESGDTGWRDLSSYLVNGAAKGGAAAPVGGAEAIRIRRVGDTVTLQASIALPTWVSGQAALDFPIVGFVNPTTYMSPGYGTAPGVVLTTGGQMRMYTSSSTPAARYMWTWITTTNTWPTTLPGTPA